MQRMECERARARKLRSRASFENTHPDAFRKVAWGTAMPATPAPPRLTVNLFGRLEVKVGDAAVESGHLSRQKVRSLLALLVLNRGRDVSRDRLAAQLWPESSASCRRKNFTPPGRSCVRRYPRPRRLPLPCQASKRRVHRGAPAGKRRSRA